MKKPFSFKQVSVSDRVTEKYYPFVTEHPLFSTTLEGETPRSHKVIFIFIQHCSGYQNADD